MNLEWTNNLESYFARHLPSGENVKITGLVDITSGWESEMYAFNLEYGPVEDRRQDALVLRLFHGAAAVGKSTSEYHGMLRLHKAGYPVPRVLLLCVEDSPLTRPFIAMERIEGRAMWSLLSTTGRDEHIRLMTLFCELFVRLHQLDWRPFVDGPASMTTPGPYTFVDEWLKIARSFIERFNMPGFFPVVEWLQARRDRVPCYQPAIVHGDFHPNNILVRDDGSPVVIDWPGVAVSDPRLDLAWTLLLAWTHASQELRDHILQGYEQLSGARVEQLDFFEVTACARRLFDVTVSLTQGAESMGMRAGAQALMQQNLDAIRSVSNILYDRAGMRIPEVERLLHSAT